MFDGVMLWPRLAFSHIHNTLDDSGPDEDVQPVIIRQEMLCGVSSVIPLYVLKC